MRKYTVTMIEATRRVTVKRVLRVNADSQGEAELFAARFHPTANIVNVEGPHD